MQWHHHHETTANKINRILKLHTIAPKFVARCTRGTWVLSRVMPTCGKSFVPFGGVKKSSREPPSGRPKRSSLHWGYVITCMQLHQSGRTCGHGLRMAPCKVGTKKDTKRTLRHVRPAFYGIFTGKILGNASSVGKICKLALVLLRVMPTCGKSFAPFGGVKKSSREPPSGRP